MISASLGERSASLDLVLDLAVEDCVFLDLGLEAVAGVEPLRCRFGFGSSSMRTDMSLSESGSSFFAGESAAVTSDLSSSSGASDKSLKNSFFTAFLLDFTGSSSGSSSLSTSFLALAGLPRPFFGASFALPFLAAGLGAAFLDFFLVPDELSGSERAEEDSSGVKLLRLFEGGSSSASLSGDARFVAFAFAFGVGTGFGGGSGSSLFFSCR